MRKLIIVFAIIGFSTSVFGQLTTTSNRIRIESTGDRLLDMKTHSPNLYSKYMSGKRMYNTGTVFIMIGGVFGAISLVQGSNENYAGQLISFSIGAVSAGTGLILWGTGKKKKNRAFRDFENQYYWSKSALPNFQLKMNPNGVGLAYVF